MKTSSGSQTDCSVSSIGRIKWIGVENVEQDAEERARGVDTKGHPPNELFVQFLFEIFQDE